MSDNPLKQFRPNKGWENLKPAKKGEVRNPNGRPKGTRHKLSQAFLADVLNEWQEHGAVALRETREKDPAVFVRVVASIIPKEYNINEGETALERLLEQYGNEELDQLIAGLCALGHAGKGQERAREEDITEQSGQVH